MRMPTEPTTLFNRLSAVATPTQALQIARCELLAALLDGLDVVHHRGFRPFPVLQAFFAEWVRLQLLSFRI